MRSWLSCVVGWWGLLLLTGGGVKAAGFRDFRLAVEAYRIGGRGVWSTIAAAIVVCCECILGGALIIGLLPRIFSPPHI